MGGDVSGRNRRALITPALFLASERPRPRALTPVPSPPPRHPLPGRGEPGWSDLAGLPLLPERGVGRGREKRAGVMRVLGGGPRRPKLAPMPLSPLPPPPNPLPGRGEPGWSGLAGLPRPFCPCCPCCPCRPFLLFSLFSRGGGWRGGGRRGPG